MRVFECSIISLLVLILAPSINSAEDYYKLLGRWVRQVGSRYRVFRENCVLVFLSPLTRQHWATICRLENGCKLTMRWEEFLRRHVTLDGLQCIGLGRSTIFLEYCVVLILEGWKSVSDANHFEIGGKKVNEWYRNISRRKCIDIKINFY